MPFFSSESQIGRSGRKPDEQFRLPERARRSLFDLLSEASIGGAGIRNEGKTRVWNWSRTVPQNVEELGPDVWQPKNITAFGTPIGSAECAPRRGREDVGGERSQPVPDLHCAWPISKRKPKCQPHHSHFAVDDVSHELMTR